MTASKFPKKFINDLLFFSDFTHTGKAIQILYNNLILYNKKNLKL